MMPILGLWRTWLSLLAFALTIRVDRQGQWPHSAGPLDHDK